MKLSQAIEANDAEAVRKAARRVKNLNRESRDNGYTPLGYAARIDADRAAAALLESGAGPDPDETLHPLFLAASEGRAKTLAVMLDARTWEPAPLDSAVEGASRQGKVPCLELLFAKASVRPTPQAMVSAAMAGRLDALKLLLERGGDPTQLHRQRDERVAPLHVAARAGYDQLIRLMLDEGVDVELPDGRGRTPLMYATLKHSSQRWARVSHRQRKRDLADPDSGIEIICGTQEEAPHARRTLRALLDAGADPNATDDAGHTGLDLLLQDNRRKAIDPWLKRTLAAAGAKPADRWPTDVLEAIGKKRIPALRELLSHGRSPNFTTSRGFSPLTQACRSRQPEAVRALLDAGADPNRPDESESPLYAAVVSQNADILRILLDAGADPNRPEPAPPPEDEEDEDRPDETDPTVSPLRLAKALRYRELVEILVEHGAKMTKPGKTQIAAGVHWWDDWELVVVKADVAAIAAALDPTGDSIDPEPLGKTFVSGGRGTFVLAQPAGLDWTNVMRASPVWRNLEDDFKQVAARLAAACQAPALHAAYSDTAGAAAFVLYGPDGQVEREDHGADLEFAEMAVSMAEESGKEPPGWAVEMIRAAEEADEDPPDSTDRLEALAQAEGFALGWAYFGVEPGGQFEVEFPEYAPRALAGVAFVDAPDWA